MHLQLVKLALEQFRKLIESPATPARERALSHLRAGQILDLQGKRSEAMTHYEEVLKSKDFEHSHDQAQGFLQRAYRLD